MSSNNSQTVPAAKPPPNYSRAATYAPPIYVEEADPTSHSGQASAPVPAPKPNKELTAEQREKMLQEFQFDRTHANDYYGGHKGAAGQFEPNDPFKPFKWVHRKLSGQKGEVSSSTSTGETKWASESEVAKGDIDTSRLA